MLEKIEGAIKNGQSRDTCNIGHKTTQNEDKQDYKHNTENYKDEQYGPHYCMFIIYHLRFFIFLNIVIFCTFCIFIGYIAESRFNQ